eukprot:maker-scaffold1224_size54636-snap-gene-0.12 protein:Tk04421 transcript:maker-scaffold1224_size54636-snap-gene-0.12-mRNA-1 annotation:"trna (guanine-n -)-methyltransferase subunit wdr4"
MASLLAGPGQRGVLTSGLKFWPLSVGPRWGVHGRRSLRGQSAASPRVPMPADEVLRSNASHLASELWAEARALTAQPPSALRPEAPAPEADGYTQVMKVKPYLPMAVGRHDPAGPQPPPVPERKLMVPQGQKSLVSPYYHHVQVMRRLAQATELTAANQHETLQALMSPFARVDYRAELALKTQHNAEIVARCHRDLCHPIGTRRPWAQTFEILPSPVHEAYRNRDEFSIGPDVAGVPKTVGFYVGDRQAGVTCVPPEYIAPIKDAHRRVAQLYQDCLRQSPWPAMGLYSAQEPRPSGHWRELEVRSNAADEIMVTVNFHPQSLSLSEIQAVQAEFVDFFVREAAGYRLQIRGVYFQIKGFQTSDPGLPQHIYGETHIRETVNDLEFLLHPGSKFPINISGTQQVLKVATNMIRPTPDLTVVDIGCGSGFYSLHLALQVKQVIGIDESSQAVSEAEDSAELNGIRNVKFEAGKLSNLIQAIVEEHEYQPGALAVLLNPGRGGAPARVIDVLRRLKDTDFKAYHIPNPLPLDGKQVQPQPESDEPLRILCGRYSSDGTLLALCDDQKQITIWDTKNWTLKQQCNLTRRANQVVFQGSEKVFVADKSGDVYEIRIGVENEPFGKLVLGHLSMLLDLVISPDGKFILTSDRDEKVRITHYPNSYHIHGFCLGHEEFVSSIAILPDNRLLSSSGDGTLKVWDYLKGQELSSTSCHLDAGLSLVKITEMSGEEKEIPPAIRQVHHYQYGNEIILTVAINQLKGLLVYKYDSPTSKLTFIEELATEEEIWNHVITSDGNLCILQRGVQSPLIGFAYSKNGFVRDAKLMIDVSPEVKAFIEESSSCSNGLDELYKRWFDNVKEYLQRKEQRIQQNHSKKNKTDDA